MLEKITIRKKRLANCMLNGEMITEKNKKMMAMMANHRFVLSALK